MSDKSFYPENAQEWLDKWDAGEIVWSIEMGGLGPGYEQCIQRTVAEILRHILTEKYEISRWNDRSVFDNDSRKIDNYGLSNLTIKQLNLTGAQFYAAKSLALYIHKNGPQFMMKDVKLKDRLIQISKKSI